MEELTMKVIKNILIFSLLIAFVETYAQSTNDNKTPLTFSGFMDNAMQKVQQFGIPTDAFYSSERHFNGKTQESTTAKLDTEFEIKQSKLHKRSGSNVKFTVKDAVTNSKTDQKGKKAFSEKHNVKALLENNPCINRKGVFDAFGGEMLFAGVNIDKENDISYAHYMWTRCEPVSMDKKDDLEVVLCYSYVFATREDTMIPIRMTFRSVERGTSNHNPFEYTITNSITMNN